jgi:Na+-transporting methylmalonyl-CoA/oxaloacetate decarboxylase gamma subunit
MNITVFAALPADLSAGIKISESLLLSVLGFLVVFMVLVILIAVIKLITAAVNTIKVTASGGAVTAAEAHPAAKPSGVPAAGSLGEIELHSVDDKTAAMLMAIVADELQAPLNELRFTSIKEIGEENNDL